MELSHRGPEYREVHEQALERVRSLLDVPRSHEVLFLQGGATGMFGLLPLNLLSTTTSADYVNTGIWSTKAYEAARQVGPVRVAGTGEVNGQFIRVPTAAELSIDPQAAYVHLTSNNTAVGTQFHEVPACGEVPLVVDMSSDIMSKPLDISRFGIIYAGAQKNLGPSGVVIVIVKHDILERCSQKLPDIFRLAAHARANSLLHTPPTFAVYLTRNVLDWLKDQGGVSAMEMRNRKKARRLYETIDASGGFYYSAVEKTSRSVMNIVFRLSSTKLEPVFIERAAQAGLIGLKGHRAVGGIRASIYNVISVEGVERLAQFMNEFMRIYG